MEFEQKALDDSTMARQKLIQKIDLYFTRPDIFFSNGSSWQILGPELNLYSYNQLGPTNLLISKSHVSAESSSAVFN